MACSPSAGQIHPGCRLPGGAPDGLSALLTTTMGEQKEVLERLEAAGLRDQVKVIVGGAPVTAAYAEEIGADGYGANAFDAVAASVQLIERAPSEEAVA
ncbi:MAG: cobalamin-dependent protein [Candidatus Hydrogenedentota bacterium]